MILILRTAGAPILLFYFTDEEHQDANAEESAVTQLTGRSRTVIHHTLTSDIRFTEIGQLPSCSLMFPELHLLQDNN